MAQAEIPNTDLDRLDLDEVKRFVARRWLLIVVVAATCVVLAIAACLSATKVYNASTQLLLDPRKQHVFGTDSMAADGALDSSIVDSQIPIILSTQLLAKVVAKENLVNDAELNGPRTQSLLDKLFALFRPAKVAKVEVPSLDGIDPKLAPVIIALFGKIDVTRVGKSYVLQITVSSRDPNKAMRLANSIADTYVEDQISVRAKSVQQAATFFEDRLGNLRDQVRQSEQAVADYRKKHGLATTTMDGQVTVGEQQLQNLNERLATTSSDTAEKVALYQQAMRFKANGADLDSLPEIIRSPVITQLRTQQADLARREADLSAMYGPAYPAITQIHAQKAGLDRAMAAEMKRLVSTFRNDAEVAKAREDSLRKTIATLTDTSGGDNEVGVKLRELERTNLANKALFQNFLTRAKLAQEQSSFEEPEARVISPALEPTAPSSPKTKLIVPVAGVAGLLLGLGLAGALDLLRKRTGGTPTARANAFILGRVPDIATSRDEKADCLAYFERNRETPFADSIERLVATLASRKEGRGRTVVLAPLSRGEGATSIALCLSAAAAAAGRRVLLIDADQARRGLSTRIDGLGLPGLGEVLAGDITANKVVVAQTRFAFLPIGRKPFDPSATAKRFRAFLGEASQRFDLVILDASSFDSGPQALAMGGLADDIVLVACWDQLMRDSFVSAIDTIADKPNFAGIVLNRTGASDVHGLAMTA